MMRGAALENGDLPSDHCLDLVPFLFVEVIELEFGDNLVVRFELVIACFKLRAGA